MTVRLILIINNGCYNFVVFYLLLFVTLAVGLTPIGNNDAYDIWFCNNCDDSRADPVWQQQSLFYSS